MSEYFVSDRGGHGPPEIKAAFVPKVGEEIELSIEWNGSEWKPITQYTPFEGARVSVNSNLGMGKGSLENIKLGEKNTALGVNAGQHLINGSNSVIVGFNALATAEERNSETVIGPSAMLKAKGAGERNVAVGYRALENLEGKAFNPEKESETEGCFNVAMGPQNLQKLKTGFSFTSVGSSALELQESGQHSSAFGESALAKNKTGSFNCAFGGIALKNFLGSEACAFGNGALQTATTAEACCAVGTNSQEKNETGNHNTSTGWGSLNLVTGGANTAFGYAAGINLTTAEKTTCLGTLAGGSGAASGGVYLGFQAGKKETESNRLYIANSETAEPLIKGVFPNSELTFNTEKIALYKGVAPVSRHAAIVNPIEELKSVREKVEEINGAIKGIGITL